MKAPDTNTVTLTGTCQTATRARLALAAARDLMPDGELRDEIAGLMVHLRYGIDETLLAMTERDREAVKGEIQDIIDEHTNR
jgi:hypothetical protein